MLIGIFLGIYTAISNSVGYLLGARFVVHYKSPVRMLATSHALMFLIALPALCVLQFFCPEIPWKRLIFDVVIGCAAYAVGQGAFFAALRYIEASRLSSLLGLKIIVLAIIFVLSGKGMLNGGQWLGVVLATAAAVSFNYAGSGRADLTGWLLLPVILVGFSMCDLMENDMVKAMQASGNSLVMSSFFAVSWFYTALGVMAWLCCLKFRPTVKQFKLIWPYSVLWLISQITLNVCFVLTTPVFGNVILASRGIFSVLIGILLPCFGWGKYDSVVPAKIWVRRIVIAVIMTSAIIIYSLATAGII